MELVDCSRQGEVIEAVSAGRWPASCPQELQSHVISCAVCLEVLEVAKALHGDKTAVAAHVRVPSAGLVWWRSELRARREAVRTAERPLTLVHAFGGAAAAGVLLALLIQTSSSFMQTFARIAGWMPESPIALLQQHLPLVLGLSVLLVVAPVALYFVLSDK